MSVAGLEQAKTVEQTTTKPSPAAHLRPHMWKPGQSGNPNGRKQAFSFTDLAREFLGEYLPGQTEITRMQALIRKLFSQAMHGDTRASKLILERVDPAKLTIRKQDLKVLMVNIIRQGPETLDAQEVLALPQHEKA